MDRLAAARNDLRAWGYGLCLVCLLLAGGSGCQRTGNDRSAVMIVVDALRADHLGAYRYRRPTSPSLDERLGDGAVLEHAIAASPWTLPRFATLRAAYDEESLGVDGELERLFRALEERGTADDAVVVFTSDRGEELFDHGGFEHGHAVYQELLHVPLAFWGPGVRPARIDAPVSHLDVLPTLLDAPGLPVPWELPRISLAPHDTG